MSKETDAIRAEAEIACTMTNPTDIDAALLRIRDLANECADAIEWDERGLYEWRSLAITAARKERRHAATLRVALRHLHTVLNECRTANEQQRADTVARDWLQSIGYEGE